MATRLFLHNPNVILQARVNMPSVTYPVSTITYDTVTSGSAGNVFPGQTILLGSSAGADDYGRQRVTGTAGPSTFPVARSSQGTHDGELTVVDDAYITILEEYRVWAKIHYIDPDTGELYVDGDVDPSGNVDKPAPKANAGIAYAGTIDPSTGTVTVSFDASDSYQFDAALSSNLSAITAYEWDVADGTITSGTATSAQITATFPAGFRYVRLKVTADNGMWAYMEVPVFARDPANDVTIPHQIVSRTVHRQGQELSVRILQDIPPDIYPDGCLAILWDDELESSSVSRPHIMFVGWHQRDEGSVQSLRTGIVKDTVLHFVDVAGRLKTLPAFSQVMVPASNPQKWTETAFPNAFYFLHYLLTWYSTAMDVADLLLGSQILNNFEFKVLGSDAGTLYEQVNGVANSVIPDHWLHCTKRGQLYLAVDPLIQNVADRPSAGLYLDDNDWTEIRYTRQRSPRVQRLLAYAIENDSTEVKSIAALAPGDVRGQGVQDIETSEHIADNQFDLNNATGNRYARMNAPYGYFTITMPASKVPSSLDPALFQWVNLSISSDNEPHRRLPFNNARGVVHEIHYQYDYQRTGVVVTATLTWEKETSGPPAVTYVLPGSGS